MSRGLGKTQRAIIELLYRYRSSGIESGLSPGTITQLVYPPPPDMAATLWDVGEPARIEATRRALRGFRSRGVVDAEWTPAITDGGWTIKGSLSYRLAEPWYDRIRSTDK